MPTTRLGRLAVLASLILIICTIDVRRVRSAGLQDAMHIYVCNFYCFHAATSVQ